MSHFDLNSVHNGVEGSGLVVYDSCWNEVSGQVVEECFGAMNGTVSSFIEVARHLCHFLDAMTQPSGAGTKRC